MIVICEECGKKYSIDPIKIKGDRAKFKCKVCDFIITVIKPVETPATSFPKPPFVEPEKEVEAKKTSALKQENKREYTREKITKGFNLKGFGIRSKMLLLFLLVPMLLVVVANILYLWQMNTLSSILTSQSAEMARNMAEDKIISVARNVSAQCKLYLDLHPGFKKEKFSYNTEFSGIALQKVGMTGYSCLYSVPDENKLSSLWVHPNSKLIGIDLPKAMKKALGREYRRWWGVYRGAYQGEESKGYYLWKDSDGQLREKFMVCTPVEDTPFVIAATTYLDEFTGPVQLLKTRAKKRAAITRNIVFGIFGATILLIGIIVTFFGYRLAGRIKSLTEVANRISIGELDAEIDISGKDEISDLGEAISRMQESIRLSIQRLRRRR